LLIHALESPYDSSAQSDLELAEPLLRLLGSLGEAGNLSVLVHMREFCFDLRRRARAALENFDFEYSLNTQDKTREESGAEDNGDNC
jgi:hypothetical protein